MSLSRALSGLCGGAGALVLLALTVSLALNVGSRLAGAPLVGANLLAAWLLPALAFCALPLVVPREGGLRGALAGLFAGIAVGALGFGMANAASRIGGTEAVLGIPVAARFLVGAVFCVLALAMAALTARPLTVLSTLLGALLGVFDPLSLPPIAALGVFFLALLVRTPVALALVAAVALVEGPLADAALAQSFLRGLSGYVLLAVPLFVFAAALLLESDFAARVLAAVRALAPRRRTALGEANVWTSLVFGGVSASSIADAATSAKLLVPVMVTEGYAASRAAAISAASAILPNVMPPSIALLLASAATDLSVGSLWFAGAIAAPVLALALLVAVRLTPPGGGRVGEAKALAGERRRALLGLVPVVATALAIVGALRLGLVTAVEAGLVAVGLAAVFTLRTRGPRAFLTALADAAAQSGRVTLLIAAAAPVAFLIATSGLDVRAFLPEGSGALALLAAVGIAILIGTVLDAGAAILLMLPLLVPALAGLGVDPVHGALTLTLALLVGGLTPPVGILILVTKEVTGADGVYRAALPYLAALLGALALIALVPLLVRPFA